MKRQSHRRPSQLPLTADRRSEALSSYLSDEHGRLLRGAVSNCADSDWAVCVAVAGGILSAVQLDMFAAAKPGDMLRDVLHRHALNAMKAAGIRRGYVECPFSLKTDDILCEFIFSTGKYRFPGREHMTPGIFNFNIYAPAAVEPDRVMEIANSLKEAFDRKRWEVPGAGHVEIEETKAVVLSQIRDGKRIGIVDAGFDWYGGW